jgi:hypothetical membrane protein
MRSKRIEIFTDRYPFLGPLFWMVSVQYYLIQILVAQAWTKPVYSISANTISDLGNTACGTYAGHLVCSPLHGLMNISFITLGLTMIAGSVLIYHEFKESRPNAFGFGAMAVAGVGTLLVGAFAENTVVTLHELGAALPFLVGNIGIIILGLSLGLPPALRIYTLLSGVLALTALAFFTTHAYLGLGIGGMERLTAYPQTTWLIVFGIYMSRSRFKR